jgi:hypothetical protein
MAGTLRSKVCNFSELSRVIQLLKRGSGQLFAPG